MPGASHLGEMHNPGPDRGMPYSGSPALNAFSTTYLTTLSLTRSLASRTLHGPRPGALAPLRHGPRCTCPAPPYLRGHPRPPLVMFLSVIRAATFPHLDRLTLVTIDTAGINGRVICAFTAGVTELMLACLDSAPLFRRPSVPTVWPSPRRIELDGVEVPSRFGL
ncbi:hypothetical protein B0H14DRAFT_2816573 [Mycena olivaceomarginata]|nr:hypothetical protein B0H14DRAFT_2816573 [Mycena olivaceomarginata]